MRLKIIFAFFSFSLFNCGNLHNESNNNALNNLKEQEDCIENIIRQDDSLGRIRNYACKTIPLSITIKQYVNATGKFNFQDCPDEFQQAFKSHTAAWSKMGEFTDEYPDLRGEMHDLFDTIEKSKDSIIFKPLLDTIWETWKEVESAKTPSKKN